MIQCACIVQEGRVTPEMRRRLEGELSAIADRHFTEELGVGWFDVAKGNGWTAGEPSKSSVVVMSAPAVSRETRTEILSAICGAWAQETGCHVNDVVATVLDRPN